VDLLHYYQWQHVNDILSRPLKESYQAEIIENFKWEDWVDTTKIVPNPHKRGDIRLKKWLFMDSRLVRIFCANLPSQQARGASYNLLLLLRKDCLFCHRSECYGPPSPSISLESIKSLKNYPYRERPISGPVSEGK